MKNQLIARQILNQARLQDKGEVSSKCSIQDPYQQIHSDAYKGEIGNSRLIDNHHSPALQKAQYCNFYLPNFNIQYRSINNIIKQWGLIDHVITSLSYTIVLSFFFFFSFLSFFIFFVFFFLAVLFVLLSL